jgi:transcriptional regulator with XRE-family HTH domain
MTQKPVLNPTIGKRIAGYRKFLKIGTAADLAARIPNLKVTASVIQNIESGRKTDLSVSQLLDIAMGLGVSPLALLVPVDSPFERVDLPGVGSDVSSLTVHEFDQWLTIPATTTVLETPEQATVRAIANFTRKLIDAVEDWKSASTSTDFGAAVFVYEDEDDDGNSFTATYDPSESASFVLGAAERDVRACAAYLRHYNVDLSWVPDIDAPKTERHG